MSGAHADRPLAHPNPLVRARAATGLSYSAYAQRIGVHRALVQYAEEGCFRSIPTCYYRKDSGVTVIDSVEYGLFRLHKRRKNFSKKSFPEKPPHSFKELLQTMGLNPYSFATKICIQYPEAWKLYNAKGPISRLPINVAEAFHHVGLSLQWIQEFEENLRGQN